MPPEDSHQQKLDNVVVDERIEGDTGMKLSQPTPTAAGFPARF